MFTETVEFDESVTVESPFPERIETDNLVFRAPVHEVLSLGEFHRFHSCECGEDMAKFNLFEKPGSLGYSRFEMFEYMRESWESMSDVYYVVEEKGVSRDSLGFDFVGIAGFNLDWDTRSAELSVWLHRDVWGNGYASERAEAFCEVLFDGFGVEDCVRFTISEEEFNS